MLANRPQQLLVELQSGRASPRSARNGLHSCDQRPGWVVWASGAGQGLKAKQIKQNKAESVGTCFDIYIYIHVRIYLYIYIYMWLSH